MTAPVQNPGGKPLRLRVLRARLSSSDCRARIPFRFGSAVLQRAPLLTLRLEVEGEDGRRASGCSSDLCVPKWFEKDPAKSPEGDILALIETARAAARAAVLPELTTVFDLWRRLWKGRVEGVPFEASDRLLRGFGVALVERAAIDAACRLAGVSFFRALRSDLFDFRPGELASDFARWSPADGLPGWPLRSIEVRHTVGLADRLRREEIRSRHDDGFPESLEEDIERYGLGRFKIKLRGQPAADRRRLMAVAGVLEERCPAPVFTLDGNEQYRSVRALVELLESVRAMPLGARLLEKLAWIEQPMPRAITFDPKASSGLRALAAFAPLVIDEADTGIEAFSRAAELGYRGVSVKNCKGVFRALLNRAVCERSAGELFQTGEDLTNLPVLALQQDLATQAALGVVDVERNGHHYFRGLDHLPREEAEAALAAHPDLYEERAGTIALRIEKGRIALGSLDRRGYGYDLAIRDDLRQPIE